MEPKLTNTNLPLNNSKFYRGDDFEFHLRGDYTFNLLLRDRGHLPKEQSILITESFSNVCRVKGYCTALLEPGFYDYEVGNHTGTIKILNPIYE